MLSTLFCFLFTWSWHILSYRELGLVDQFVEVVKWKNVAPLNYHPHPLAWKRRCHCAPLPEPRSSRSTPVLSLDARKRSYCYPTAMVASLDSFSYNLKGCSALPNVRNVQRPMLLQMWHRDLSLAFSDLVRLC